MIMRLLPCLGLLMVALSAHAQAPAPRPVPPAATRQVAPKTAAPARRRPATHKPPSHARHGLEAAAKPVAKPALRLPPPPPAAPDVGTVTGLHLPRFAALKTDTVNMRSGPGERYPILWVYKRRDLPVQIEREFDIWRLVEDMDGTKGWIHQATLSGRRSFVISGDAPRTLRDAASETAAAVAVLKPGVIGRLKACDAGAEWCQAQVQEYRGWLKRADFWGAAPGEAVQP